MKNLKHMIHWNLEDTKIVETWRDVLVNLVIVYIVIIIVETWRGLILNPI